MKNGVYLRNLPAKGAKFAKMAVCIGVAGSMLIGGNTLIASAATLADVFDAKQYADDYKDLKAAFGYDEKALLNHYLTYGINEKRQVKGLIDVVEYREKYADLDAAFGDDWNAYVNHYLTYGIYEGRDSGTDFNALDYGKRYADLKEAYGDDLLALYEHYLVFGKTEDREARSEAVVEAERQAAEAADASEAAVSGARIDVWYHGYYKYVDEYDSDDHLIKRLRYVQEVTLYSRDDYTYDSAGKLVKETTTYYRADGTVSSVDEYRDGNKNKLTRRITYNEDGSWFDIKFEYNEAGTSWVKETSTSYRADGIRRSASELVKNDAGNIVKNTTIRYQEDGSLDSTIVIDMDDTGKIVIKKTYIYYYANGQKRYQSEYDGDDNFLGSISYNEDGDVTEETIVDGDGERKTTYY